jgi:hypothetical protein
VERTSALVDLERRALQIHPELGPPSRGGIRAGAPPDALAQPSDDGSTRSSPAGFGNIGPRVRPREALAAQHLEQHLGVAPAMSASVIPSGRGVTEVAPAVDHLLGRSHG